MIAPIRELFCVLSIERERGLAPISSHLDCELAASRQLEEFVQWRPALDALVTMEPPAIRTKLGSLKQRLRRQIVVLLCPICAFPNTGFPGGDVGLDLGRTDKEPSSSRKER